MSIPDSFVARTGVAFALPFVKGLGMALGGRAEGVPVYDLIGSSRGFRRPRIALSIDPTISLNRGKHTVSISVPVAVYRNRWRSVSDKQVDQHGDAAFADWFLIATYAYRF